MGDAVVEDVDGVAMRPIPLRRYHWSSVPWISETGILRRRHFNARTGAWHWEAADVVPIEDPKGRLGHRLQNQFRTIAQLVALAWVHRSTPMSRMAKLTLVRPTEGVVAYNLRYADERDESDDDITILDAEDGAETWAPLECKVGIVPCVDTGYRISDRRRVMTPTGVVSNGVGGLGGFFCMIPNVPPVPVERVAGVLFGRPRREKPPPRIKTTMLHLKKGATIRSLARALRIKETTAWSYAHAAMRFVSTRTAREYTMQLIDAPDVAHELGKLVDRSPELLHAPLRQIVDVVTRSMAADPDWRSNPHRYAEVSALRSLLQREA